MKISRTIAAAIAGCALVPALASAAVIGGTNYASQYDYGEFFSIADHHDFKVVLAGNPFPATDLGSVARDLLPVMQAAKPRPALTFTYDAPVERPRPYYRLVQVFDSAPDLGSYAVCNGTTRTTAGRPGVLYLYAVYCRNDQAMSETTAWVQATGPTDPRVGQLFRELFQVVFTDSPAYGRNLNGRGGMRN
jgi:hypothetical protein